MLERVKEIYSDLGKKAESEGGKKGMKSRWHPNNIRFTESSKPYEKIDTHKELAEHANISKDTATKIIYINKNLDLTNEEDRHIKKKLELGDEKPGKAYKEIQTKKAKQKILAEK